MKDDRLYLLHIVECISRIERYTAEGREAFLSDNKTQDAVLRNLHTLSESTQRISEALKGKHNEIDWRAVSAFRNVIVHDYLGVDLKEIWDVVEHDLPTLKHLVTRILQELNSTA